MMFWLTLLTLKLDDMDGNKKQLIINYLIIVLLFSFVVFLWVYLGGWQKSFNFYKKNNSEKNFSITEVTNLWSKSRDKFSQLAPQANFDLLKKEGIANKIVDQALNKSTVFNNQIIKYPDIWEIDPASSTTSTLIFLAEDKEKFFIKTMDSATSTSLVTSWHEQNNENVLGWSWQEVGEGLVGFKVDNNSNQGRIVGLFQSTTSTAFVLERQSKDLEKIKDGRLEVIIYGLRK